MTSTTTTTTTTFETIPESDFTGSTTLLPPRLITKGNRIISRFDTPKGTILLLTRIQGIYPRMNHDTGQTFYTLTFREGPTLNYDYDEMIEIEGIDEFDD